MTKNKNADLSYVLLTLFIILAPTVASAADKKAVIYASFCLISVALGCRIYSVGRVFVTKTFVMLCALAAFLFVQLVWVSDKSSQFALAVLFTLAAECSLLIADYKLCMTSEAFGQRFGRSIYTSAVFYAVTALLHQIFIESSFFGCNMDLGNGSATFGAIMMSVGITTGLKIFKNKKKNPEFLAGLVLMSYVFAMTKSLPGYLMITALLLFYTLHVRHKRTEAFFALVGTVILAVINIVALIAAFVTNREAVNGAFKGIVSVIGVGNGGYNASSAVTDGGYGDFTASLSLMIEVLGVIGLCAVIVWIIGGILAVRKRPGVINMLGVLALCTALMATKAAMVFMVPCMAMFYAYSENSQELYINRYLSLVIVLPTVFVLLLTTAYVPYAIGNSAYDAAKYEQAAEYYSVGASMEIFNDKGWEKAYSASYKAFSEQGVDNTALQREYLENAIKFNKKNYKYKRLLADAYTNGKDYTAALEVWEDIISRHDKEYLYPMYAQKIYDVMANCPIGLEKTEELYGRLSEYAEKSVDKQIKLEVNNIMAKSQRFYVDAREGTDSGADMYWTEPVEIVTEEST